MKRIKKASELLWLMGITLVALGVTICSKANLGVSMIAAPAFVIYDAIADIWEGFSIGMVEYVFQGALLIILCIVIRQFKWRFLLAFLAGVIYGYFLNFFLWIFRDVSFDTVATRWVMLIVGDVVTATGVAAFFRTYMPLQVYELFVAALSSHFRIDINKIKWGFDIALLIISGVLAFTLFTDATTFNWSSIGYSSFHSIGLGTLVTTVINSPIIKAVGKILDRVFEATPRFPSLEKILTGKKA